MSIKVEELLKRTQDIQKFVVDRVSQDPVYTNVDQTLKELHESLKARKLTLHVVGQDLAQAQALHRLLELSGELQSVYQLKISALPKLPDPSAPPPPPTLVFQPSSEAQSSVRYELNASQSQVIGRNPATAQLLLPDHLNLTSGSHAELRCLEDNWQIRDLGSRNGTFINDDLEKLQGWYRLKVGDRVCLGSKSQALGSATLIFETPSPESICSVDADAQRVLSCNILCLIIPPQPLPEMVQRFIQLAKDAQIAKLFIVVDRPGEIAATVFEESLAEIESSIKSDLKSISFELVSLLLKPSTPSSGATIITPHAQPEFEAFCKNLESLAKEKLEVILREWATTKLVHAIGEIETVLTKKEFDLKEKLQQDEVKFKELSKGDFKKQAEKFYKKVDGDRDSFFRQLKNELSQSKASLLDEFRQSSISYKIQQFTKQLQPQISDQGGYRCVRLKVGTRDTSISSKNDVHTAVTELCHTELARWATAEWFRIQTEYSGGGLESLFRRSYESLNFVCELKLPKDGFAVSQTLNIQSILAISSVEPTLELRYKQANFWGYISKTLRTNIMMILGMITMLGGGLIAFNKAMLIPPLLPIVISGAFLSYKHEREAKIEELSEKLQKEATSYYQSYTKGLVDRLTQHIGGLLEAEERRFRENLENVKEFYASHQAELDRTQNQIKSKLDEMKRSGQSRIEKDLIELRKLKQSILF